MGSWLGAGAGASEGLDSMLSRMLAEDRLAEVKRSNMAHEALSGRQIDEQGAYRQAMQAAQQQQHDFTQANTTAGTLAMGPVDPATRDYLVKTGVRRPEQFDTTTGSRQTAGILPMRSLTSSPGPTGEAPEAAPPLADTAEPAGQTSTTESPGQTRYLGTGKEQEASRALKRQQDADKAKQDQLDYANYLAERRLNEKPESTGPQEHFTYQPEFNENSQPTGRHLRLSTSGGPPTIVEPPAGFGPTRPQPGASQAAGEEAHMERARRGLDALDKEIDIAAKKGLLGRGKGTLADIEQWASVADPEVSALGTRMLTSKMLVDAGIGGMRGASSPQLLKAWGDMLSNKLGPESLHATVKAMKELVAPRARATAPGTGLTAEQLIEKYGK